MKFTNKISERKKVNELFERLGNVLDRKVDSLLRGGEASKTRRSSSPRPEEPWAFGSSALRKGTRGLASIGLDFDAIYLKREAQST